MYETPRSNRRPGDRGGRGAGRLPRVLKRTIALYSAGIAATAFLLHWLEYRYLVRRLPFEIYVAVIAILFTVLGVWVGSRLTARRADAEGFEKNLEALEYLGISDREYEVLELLATGRTNKEMAADLFVSLNTIKSHLASLYGKLDVSRRTQAVQRARELGLIP